MGVEDSLQAMSELLAANFSAKQKRDKEGRWTSGGGVGGKTTQTVPTLGGGTAEVPAGMRVRKSRGKGPMKVKKGWMVEFKSGDNHIGFGTVLEVGTEKHRLLSGGRHVWVDADKITSRL